tara:strand:- start:1670 stop:2236 length:567 start_codon:yes stop_codon:yes gene_type:complete
MTPVEAEMARQGIKLGGKLLGGLFGSGGKTSEEGFKKGYDKIKEDTRTVPLVPSDFMRMYGDLADLIGFGTSFRGYGPSTMPMEQMSLVNEFAPENTNNQNLATANLDDAALRELGLPQSEIDSMLGQSNFNISQNYPRPETQEEYDALPPGSYFYDDEGLKQKPQTQAPNMGGSFMNVPPNLSSLIG